MLLPRRPRAVACWLTHGSQFGWHLRQLTVAWRRLVPRNNERGVQCHGQGKRHQNPPMRVQPKGDKRQAKWSNPNPKASSGGASSAATKARKNFKAVQ